MECITVHTRERNQMIDITREVQEAVAATGRTDGLVTVFCPHTTAAITVNENTDPSVCRDILHKLATLIPRRETFYRHGEGNSDSHLKSSLMGVSKQFVLDASTLQLGTWQAIYFCEFDGPRARTVWVSVS